MVRSCSCNRYTNITAIQNGNLFTDIMFFWRQIKDTFVQNVFYFCNFCTNVLLETYKFRGVPEVPLLPLLIHKHLFSWPNLSHHNLLTHRLCYNRNKHENNLSWNARRALDCYRLQCILDLIQWLY